MKQVSILIFKSTEKKKCFEIRCLWFLNLTQQAVLPVFKFILIKIPSLCNVMIFIWCFIWSFRWSRWSFSTWMDWGIILSFFFFFSFLCFFFSCLIISKIHWSWSQGCLSWREVLETKYPWYLWRYSHFLHSMWLFGYLGGSDKYCHPNTMTSFLHVSFSWN